jgi:hypothetical protein
MHRDPAMKKYYQAHWLAFVLTFTFLLNLQPEVSAASTKQWRKYRDGARTAVKENRFEDALKLYVQAFDEAEANWKGTDLRYLDTANEAAQVHIQLRKFSKAIEMLNLAIKRMPNPRFDEVRYATTFFNMIGSAQLYSRDLPAALETYKMSVAFAEKKFGDVSHHLAEALRGLATVQMEQKDFPAAQKTLERALGIVQNTLAALPRFGDPTNHLYYEQAEGSLQNTMAILNLNRSNYVDAEKWFKDAIQTVNRLPGNHNANTAALYENLSLAHRGQREYDEAEDALIRVLNIGEDSKGSALMLAQASLKLGALHFEQNDAQLDRVFQRLLSGKLREANPKNFPHYLEGMARYYAEQDADRSKKLLERAKAAAPQFADEISKIAPKIENALARKPAAAQPSAAAP